MKKHYLIKAYYKKERTATQALKAFLISGKIKECEKAFIKKSKIGDYWCIFGVRP